MDQATKDAFASLTQTVEHGFSALADDITEIKDETAEIRADIANIRRSMATKDELTGYAEGFNQRFDALHAEIRSVRVDLDELIEKFGNVPGYRKEIDHALERIAAIERHLGIKPKLTA